MEMSECPGLRGSPKPGLPSAVENIFNALRDEITQLNIRWETCMELFLEDESKSSLNEVAPGAFSVIWQVFKDDFFTTLYRITDPRESGPRANPNQNLTLDQLHHAIDSSCNDRTFLQAITERLHEIDSHCKPIRKIREKIIGHFDMPTILEPNSNPLPNVTWEDLKKALQLLAEFMNEISVHFTGGYIDFVPTITGPAKNIVYGLREFKRLQLLEYEQQQAELREEIEQNAIISSGDPAH